MNGETYFERLQKIKQGLLPKEAVAKEKRPIKRVSDKKQIELNEKKKEQGDTELVKWYKARQKQLTGRCSETGLVVETKNFKYAIASICHLLPKSTCPSVSTHPLNWIELNIDFHFKFDAMSWEEKEKLGCWPIIQERLIHVWECLAPEERRHFPDSVRNYIEKNNSFTNQ